VQGASLWKETRAHGVGLGGGCGGWWVGKISTALSSGGLYDFKTSEGAPARTGRFDHGRALTRKTIFPEISKKERDGRQGRMEEEKQYTSKTGRTGGEGGFLVVYRGRLRGRALESSGSEIGLRSQICEYDVACESHR